MKASGSMALHWMGLAATWLIQLACAGQSSPLGLTESMRASQHVAMQLSLSPDDAQAVLKAALPYDACLSHWKAVQDSLEAAPIAEAELLAALGDIRMELGRCRSERTAAMRGCLSQEQQRAFDQLEAPARPNVLHFGLHNRIDCVVCKPDQPETP